MLVFNWDKLQYRDDGKVLLLWRHERLFEEGLIRRGTGVLDVGGWGHLSERILQEGGYCLILDKFTEDQYYPDRVRSLPHVVGDICDSRVVQVLGAEYDLVTCFEVLEHVEDQQGAIYNMWALIKDNGWIAGTVPVPGGTHPADDPTVHFINSSTLRYFLEKAGFRNILIESTASINQDDPVHPSLYFKGQK